jgi:hypothetical protein
MRRFAPSFARRARGLPLPPMGAGSGGARPARWGQQRLVHAAIVLKLALRALSNGDTNATDLAAEGLRHAEQANLELRELAHGILPAALTPG